MKSKTKLRDTGMVKREWKRIEVWTRREVFPWPRYHFESHQWIGNLQRNKQRGRNSGEKRKFVYSRWIEINTRLTYHLQIPYFLHRTIIRTCLYQFQLISNEEIIWIAFFQVTFDILARIYNNCDDNEIDRFFSIVQFRMSSFITLSPEIRD